MSSTNAHCTHPGGPAYCKSATCPGRSRYLDFKKNAKPLALNLDNEDVVISIADYEADEIPFELEDDISGTLDYADEIEFMNHGDSKKEFLTLQNLISNPKNMRGNCLPVSEAIVENSQLGSDFEVSVAEIKYGRGMHAAVQVITPEGRTLIVDYTMRQFDSEAPFPFIADKNEWEARIDTYVEHIWLDQRKA